MNYIETSIRRGKSVECSGCVSLDLGTLTTYAGASPLTNIRVDTRPDEPGRDEFLSCSNAEEGETMDGVEHSASPRPEVAVYWWKCHSLVGRLS